MAKSEVLFADKKKKKKKKVRGIIENNKTKKKKKLWDIIEFTCCSYPPIQ